MTTKTDSELALEALDYIENWSGTSDGIAGMIERLRK